MPGPDLAQPRRPRGLARVLSEAPVVGVRILQAAIDMVLLAALCLVPLAATLLVPRNPDGTASVLVMMPVLLLVMLACAVLSWWYWVMRPVRSGGRTFAMGWLGLRVLDVSRRPASALQLGIRWVMLLVDGMLFGAVGLVSMLLTPQHQRLGDVVAGTVVVRVTDSPSQPPAGPRRRA